jgi:hypothetical protein
VRPTSALTLGLCMRDEGKRVPSSDEYAMQERVS